MRFRECELGNLFYMGSFCTPFMVTEGYNDGERLAVNLHTAYSYRVPPETPVRWAAKNLEEYLREDEE